MAHRLFFVSLVVILLLSVAYSQQQQQQKQQQKQQQQAKVQPLQARIDRVGEHNIHTLDDWRAWLLVFQNGHKTADLNDEAVRGIGYLRVAIVDVKSDPALARQFQVKLANENERVFLYFPETTPPDENQKPKSLVERNRQVMSDLTSSVSLSIKEAIANSMHLVLELAEEDLNKFLVKCTESHLPGVILYSDQYQLPEWYHQLAYTFSEFFSFGIMLRPEPQRLLASGVRLDHGLPSLHLMFLEKSPDHALESGQADFRAIMFPGELTLAGVIPFLARASNDFLRNGYYKKLADKMKDTQDEYQASSEPLPPLKEIVEQTPESWSTACGDQTSGICVVALLDGAASSAAANELVLNTMRFVQERRDIRSRPVHFMWVDASCHIELCEQLNIPTDQLPMLVSIRPRNRQIARFTNTIEENALYNFISNSLSGSTKFLPYSQTIVLQERDCAEEHAKAAADQVEDADEDLDEILAEILAAERQREAELEAEMEREREEAKRKEKEAIQEALRAKNAADRKVSGVKRRKVVKKKSEL